MSKINNKTAYPIDNQLSLDDFVIGSDADNLDRTRNYLLRGIFSTFKTSLNLSSIEYIFAGGSNPDLDETDKGYFTTNSNNTLAGAITTININKEDLNSIDLTSLVTTVSGNLSSFMLVLYKPSATGQIFYFQPVSIVDNTTHYTITVNNFVGGNSLTDESTYTLSFDLAGVPSTLTETDPIFLASDAAAVTADKIANWDTAFGWGNHASAGYQAALGGSGIVKSTLGTISYVTDNSANWNTAFGWGNHATVGYLTGETDPVFSAHPASGVTSLRLSQWDTAFNWGNHAAVGYITSYTETDPVFSASAAFGITSIKINEWNAAYQWGDHDGLYVDFVSNQYAIGGEKTFTGAVQLFNGRVGVQTPVFGGARLGDSGFQTPAIDIQSLNIKDAGQKTAMAMFATPVSGSDGYVMSMKNFVDDVFVWSIAGIGNAVFGGVGREIESTIGLRNDFTGGQFTVLDMFNQDYDAATEVANAQGWVAIHGGGAAAKEIGLWRYDTVTYTPIWELSPSNVWTFGVDVNVPDEVYGVGWNGSTEVPTKNAIYDKIETLGGGAVDSVFGRVGAITAQVGDYSAFYVQKSGDTMTGNLNVPTLFSTNDITRGFDDVSTSGVILKTISANPIIEFQRWGGVSNQFRGTRIIKSLSDIVIENATLNPTASQTFVERFRFSELGNFTATGTGSFGGASLTHDNGTTYGQIEQLREVGGNSFVAAMAVAGGTGYSIFTNNDVTGGVTKYYEVGGSDPRYYDGSVLHKIWHAGNDGAGSGLDADLFQGIDKQFFARNVASSSNTGSANNNKYTKFARVEITSQFADAQSVLTVLHKSDGGGAAKNNTVKFRVKQQQPFGNNPNIDLIKEWTNYDSAQYGYVLVQNTPTAIVDFYVRIPSTFDSVDFYTNASSNESRITWLSNQPFVTIPTGHVSATDISIWNSGNDGAGSGLDADLLDGLQSTSFARIDTSQTYSRSSGVFRFANTAGDTSTNTGSKASLEVYQITAGADAFMAFHVAGDYAAYLGLDGTTNDLFFGGWSNGSTKHKVWHAGNDGAGSGLDADNLDGNSGFYYDHRAYTQQSNYLGGGYISGGLEKPTYFGSGRLKLQMLRGSSGVNLGAPDTWNDVVWMSGYTGGDVKLSNALIFGKNSASVGFCQQNFDAANWGTYYSIWHSGANNTTSGTIVSTGNEIRVEGTSPRLRFVESGFANQWTFIQDSDTFTLREDNTANIRLTFDNGGAATFTSTITASNFILSSDRNLKKDIKPYEVKSIDVDWVTFKWKADELGEEPQLGVIAQDLEKKHPEFVYTDDKGIKSVGYTQLLIAKVAEQEEEIDELKIRMDRLEMIIKELL